MTFADDDVVDSGVQLSSVIMFGEYVREKGRENRRGDSGRCQVKEGEGPCVSEFFEPCTSVAVSGDHMLHEVNVPDVLSLQGS